MKITSTSTTATPLRKVGAVLGAVVLSIALLSGCGDDSSAEGDGAGAAAGQESGNGTKATGDGLPEGFPADVPLPEFDSARKIGGDSGPDVDHEWWSILLMLENPTDTPVEDYAAQLSDAGYTVTTEEYATEAEGPEWEISFHSSMENTLTVGVSSK